MNTTSNLLATLPRPVLESVPGLRVGIDIARISAVAESLAQFGDHYLRRIFSPAESAYAVERPEQTAQRLAARFAAKEAAMKAFGLSEAGVAWTDIEVLRAPDGACTLGLHATAAACAERGGWREFAVSLSHDGDYAAAVVAAVGRSNPSQPEQSTNQKADTMYSPENFDAKIRQILVKHGRLHADPMTLAVTADLYQAGMSSHASVNVMLALEGSFDTEFPDELLKRSVFSSIASIRDALMSIGETTTF